MTLAAFQIQGNTQAIAASSAGSAAVQVSTGSQQGMYVSNPTTQPVYVAAGSSSIQAAYPTTSAPALGLCLRAGAERTLVTPPAGWLSAATSGGALTIFATPGFGQ